MDKKLNGQVTVFLSLILAIILSLICTTLESMRIQGIRYKLDLATNSALDSVFSEFEPDLWSKYGLLALDGGYGSNYLSTDKIMSEYERYITTYYNPTLPLIPNINFYNMSEIMADVVDIKMLTEEGGVFFESEVIDYMKYKEIGNLVDSLLDKINIFKKGSESKDKLDEIAGSYNSTDWEKYSEKLNGSENNKSTPLKEMSNKNWNRGIYVHINSSYINSQTKIGNNILDLTIGEKLSGEKKKTDSTYNILRLTDAEDGILNLGADNAQESESGVTNDDIDKSVKESVIEQIKGLSSTPILLLTCPDSVGISAETISEESKSRLPSVTDIDTVGSMNLGIVEDVARNVLYNEYVLDKFKNINSAKQNEEGLRYEVEYILSGKGSDRENLESVINKILLIREGMNVLAIVQDPVKMEEALSMATVIIGWSGIPLLITAVQFLLVAMWAYGESIIDIRTMLDDGKVPVIKSTTEWNVSLEGLSQMALGRFVEGKKSNNGLSYKDYLRILLFMETSKKKYYRTMDIVQLNMQKINKNFYLNQCIYSLEIDTLVSAKTVFLSVPISQHMINGRNNYFISNTASRTY